VLSSLVGPAFAAEILFSARRFSAQEALAMGLVNRVVPAADLEREVRELAATIADNAPLTVRAAKAALRDLQRDPAQRDVAAVQALIDACYSSDDYREGQTAFAEKRPPRFQGR
jgi:enoyl-CoA hydratase/carnithine racemase